MIVIFFLLAIVGGTFLMGLLVFAFTYRVKLFAKALDDDEAGEMRAERAMKDAEKLRLRELWFEDRKRKQEEHEAAKKELSEAKKAERIELKEAKAAERRKKKELTKVKKKPRKK